MHNSYLVKVQISRVKTVSPDAFIFNFNLRLFFAIYPCNTKR